MASAFTTGQKLILVGDFGKYYVRKVGAPVIGVRREYYWPNIGLAGIVRLDGDLIQTERGQAPQARLILPTSGRP
jgi:HK97 family phage major capsid protein